MSTPARPTALFAIGVIRFAHWIVSTLKVSAAVASVLVVIVLIAL